MISCVLLFLLSMDVLLCAVAAESEVPGISTQVETPAEAPRAEETYAEEPAHPLSVAPAPVDSPPDAPPAADTVPVEAPPVGALPVEPAFIEPAPVELNAVAPVAAEVFVPKGPVPPFPSTNAVYTVDADNQHIIRIDISKTGVLEPADKRYLVARMSEPWVTAIVKGATNNLSPHLWNFEYIRTRCATLMYHKYRVFRRAEGSTVSQPNWDEKEWTSMTIGDYGRYLDTRRAALSAGSGSNEATRWIKVAWTVHECDRTDGDCAGH